MQRYFSPFPEMYKRLVLVEKLRRKAHFESHRSAETVAVLLGALWLYL